MVVTAKVSERAYSREPKKIEDFWNAVTWILLGALVGARVWHVVTDWHLYTDVPIEALYVWNGGLSIIGAFVGVFGGAVIAVKKSKKKIQLLDLLDVVAIGLPFGQAIGRLGNWFNQELYGLPTQLPWKLYIDPQHRLAGYELQEYYHPLFAYELLVMLIVGAMLWLFSKTNSFFKVGTGMISLLYLASYGWIRFFLEFLRLDKTVVAPLGLGVNQVIMLVVAITATLMIVKKYGVFKK